MSLPRFLVQYDLFLLPLGVYISHYLNVRVNVYGLLVVSCLSAVFLTFFGLASIGLSCLMALFLYHVVFGVRYLGILNGVAAFVIIGIGMGKRKVFSFIL